MRCASIALLALAACGYPRLASLSGDGQPAGNDAGSGGEGPPADARLCYGTMTGTVYVCFTQPLVGAIELGTDQTIPTDTSPMCGMAPQAPDVCIVSAGMIKLDASVIVTVTGSRPLVLIADTVVSIDGTLDGGSYASSGMIGPNADPSMCSATTQASGVGGGAGGSFGGMGGNGGGDTSNVGGAVAGPTAGLSLRGGCRGSQGAGVNAGSGGHGGGAIWILAGMQIGVGPSGAILVPGAGGDNGATQSSGGCGGGAGGLVGLEAPTVSIAGQVDANGGGGAGGGSIAGESSNGGDSSSANVVAAGSIGATDGGGEGGDGSVEATPAQPGSRAMSSDGAGGGGGGGAGYVKIITSSKSITGVVSPDPS